MDNEEDYKKKPRNFGRNAPAEKPKDLKTAVKKLVHYLNKLLPLVIAALVLSCFSSVLSIIGPNRLSDLTNEITNGLITGMNFDTINSIALFLLIIYLVSALFDFLQGIIMATVANKFAQKMRTQISKKINKLPLRYFDTHSYGDLLSRVTNDVDTIAMSLSQSLGTLVGAITLFIGSIIMMFYTNWILAITGIVSSLLGFVAMFVIMAKSQKYFNARQVELGKLNGHIEEIYSNHNVVNAYNGQKEASETFDKLNQSVYECNKKSRFLSGLSQPIMSFIGNFSYVAVCVVGAILTMNGSITFGVIVAFMMYIRLFTGPLTQIAQGMTNLQTTAAASERVFEFLEEPEMVKQGSRFGVKLKATAPSIHMIKTNVTTEVSPIVGSEKQSEELVNYLLSGFENDPKQIWESNIFGKSLHELVNEGLQTKLSKMPEDAQMKLQETLERIVNEGSGGLICIIL